MILTFLFALSLDVTPLPGDLSAWRPPWLALVAIYWALAYPRRYGLAVAWLTGLVLDVLKGGVLGQHALAMTVTVWLVLRFHLRLRVFPAWQRTAAAVGLVAIHQFLVFWVDGMAGSAELSWDRITPTIVALFAWPVVTVMLDRLRDQPGMQA